jgi:outer membrane protein TolC
MFDPAAARRLAEARLQLEEASRVRAVTEVATRNRIDLLWLAVAASEKRIKLLTDAVAVAKQRQDSITRLVLAGVRPEADLVEVANDVARRESDLLAVRVDRWKLQQRMRYQGAQSAERRAQSTVSQLLPSALRPLPSE